MKSVIIVGSGPAGISASLYTIRAGIRTLVIANGSGSLGKADKIENYYGFESPISGTDLLSAGISQAKRLGVEFIHDEVVGLSVDSENSLSSASSQFTVKTQNSQYHSEAVILATGSSRTAPPIKGLKELEGQGVSYCAVCDAFFYRNKDIAVLGNGGFALNEITELLPVVNTVTLLTDGSEPAVDFPKEIKIEKQKIRKLEAGPVNPLFGTSGPLESVILENNEQLKVSGVFVAYGTAGSTALAQHIGAFTEGNKISVDNNMATNIPGLYAAGDCIGGLLQIAKAVSDGAIAGTSALKYLRQNK